MWALVESGSITKLYARPKSLTIGDVQYPRNIFNLWTSSQLESLGIYKVVIDNTNLKDDAYYNNTNQTFAFADGTVTASYETATARPLDNVLFTAQNETDGLGTEGEVKKSGIRQRYIDTINLQAAGNLQATDWLVIRAAEGGTAVPSGITTKRAAVRTKANAMCTLITDAADVPALIALYTYNDATPPVRPLGDLPLVD